MASYSARNHSFRFDTGKGSSNKQGRADASGANGGSNGRSRLSMHDERNGSASAAATSSKTTLDNGAAPTTRRGTVFSAPKHGDEIPEDQRRVATQVARQARRSGVPSPYTPGRDTSDSASRMSTRNGKRKEMATISPENFYGTSSSVGKLAIGTPTTRPRAGSQSMQQYRNGTANNVHVVKTLPPRASKERLNARRSSSDPKRSPVLNRDPIEISSDEGDKDDDDDDEDVRSPGETFGSSRSMANGTTSSSTQQGQQSTATKGKEAFVEIQPNPTLPTSPLDRRGSAARWQSASRSPSDERQRATRSPTAGRQSSSGSTSRNASPEHLRLNPNRHFTIATENDARTVAEQATAADGTRLRPNMASRMRGRDNKVQEPTKTTTAASSRAKAFAQTMDSFAPSLPRRAEKTSNDGRETNHQLDLQLDIVYFFRFARCEQGAEPTIARIAQDSVTIEWSQDGERQNLQVTADDVKRVVITGYDGCCGRCMLDLKPQCAAAKQIIAHFRLHVSDEDLETFEREPAIFLESSADGKAAQAWGKFNKHVKLLVPNKIEEEDNMVNYCTSHLVNGREMAMYTVGPAKEQKPTNASSPSARPRPRPSQGAKDATSRKEGALLGKRRVKSPEVFMPKTKIRKDDSRALVWPLFGQNPMALKQSDVDRLDEGEFLNDTMIEFGLKYLLEGIRERNPQLADEIYIFSSFFYRRFTEDKRDRERERSFASVKKWTRNVDIFKKKYLVMPVNESFHWYLVIITNPFQGLPVETQETFNTARDESTAAPGESEMMSASRTLNADAALSEGFRTPDRPLDDAQDAAMADALQIPVTDKRVSTASRSQTPVVPSRKPTPEFEGDHPNAQDAADSPSDVKHDDEVEFSGEGASNKKRRVNSVIDIDDDDQRFPGHGRSLRSRGPAVDIPLAVAQPTRRTQTEENRVKHQNWLAELSVVLVFDSLGKRHGATIRKTMHEYLCREYRDKRGGEIDKDAYALKDIDVAMPQQNNFYDCGFYVLYAFERFFQEPERFMTDVIPSRNAKHDCWDADAALTRRKWWRDEVLRLAQEFAEREEVRRKQKEQKRAQESASPAKDEEDTEMAVAEATNAPAMVNENKEGNEKGNEQQSSNHGPEPKAPSPMNEDRSETETLTAPTRFPFAVGAVEEGQSRV